MGVQGPSMDCCTVFQEPFFLHPPGSKPRDGIYINPRNAYINQELQKSKSKESFYLHSPHDLVYTKITRLFIDAGKTTEKEADHAYEQICVRTEEPSSISPAYHKNESSNGSNDSSTPSLSREGSTERVNELLAEIIPDEESREIESQPVPPPPPPPFPPLTKQTKDVVVLVVGAEKKSSPGNIEEARSGNLKTIHLLENLLDHNAQHSIQDIHLDSTFTHVHTPCTFSCSVPGEPEPPPSRDDPAKNSHLITRHMVLPFIPPKFTNSTNDSETLLKPSEYLKSICKVATNQKNSLSKARSVDNLDIQGNVGEKGECTIPPPPPVPVPLVPESTDNQRKPPEGSKSSSQPLATISIQDLTSIQLRRTSVKINATKAFSVPPARSISMTNVSEPFFVQKTDLIAELKRTKDIPGIKKSKVEKAQVEKTQEKNLLSEINRAFNVSKFVDQIPEKDSSGNVIPIWKRQMLARKAAERARKELEEQMARESEEKRQKAIPPWKRQLLAKRDGEEKRMKPELEEPSVPTSTLPVNIEIAPVVKKEIRTVPKGEKLQDEGNPNSDDEDQIIPWRAQLRKTNSKLKVLD